MLSVEIELEASESISFLLRHWTGWVQESKEPFTSTFNKTTNDRRRRKCNVLRMDHDVVHGHDFVRTPSSSFDVHDRKEDGITQPSEFRADDVLQKRMIQEENILNDSLSNYGNIPDGGIMNATRCIDQVFNGNPDVTAIDPILRIAAMISLIPAQSQFSITK
eukprot:762757-Hanusia_phi.AAC.2